MTLNILFFTITIKKHEVTREEANHKEIVDSLFEKHKDRQITMHHLI
ncbi:YrzI family small protein [Neobacillus dielmonensis]|nr:YrzI family small protein [Neobacillus dielmonensis]